MKPHRVWVISLLVVSGARLQAQRSTNAPLASRIDNVRLVFHSTGPAPATAFVLFQGGIAQTATRVP